MTDQPKDEPKVHTCPKCGSDMLARGVLSYGGVSFTQKPPSERFWGGSTSVKAFSYVCVRCGYAEMYAIDPQKLAGE